MAYIITNLHTDNYSNLEKNIKKAINPCIILQSGAFRGDHLDTYYNKFKNIIPNRYFFGKLSFINCSKYLNSKIQVYDLSRKNYTHYLLSEWNDQGKLIRYNDNFTYTL
jgi:hypothetical protein